jgi:hypothetical protein
MSYILPFSSLDLTGLSLVDAIEDIQEESHLSIVLQRKEQQRQEKVQSKVSSLRQDKAPE